MSQTGPAAPETDAAVEIEQRLIGWLFRDSPGAVSCLADIHDETALFDPLHARIVEAIVAEAAGGVSKISVAAIALRMADDPGLQQVGGREYLSLMASAAPVETSHDHGRKVIEAEMAMHHRVVARERLVQRVSSTNAAILAGDPDALLHLHDLGDLLAAAGAERKATIIATPFRWKDPATLPTRDWLYGRHLIRNFPSATIAPGGVGKTTLGIAEELAMVTGRPLLGQRVPRPLRVWSWNLEDPADETARRLAAACLHYGIREADIGGRLFIDSGRDQPCVIARGDRNGAFIIQPVVEKIIAEAIANKIDVLRIDPFVSCHAVSENDNGAIDMVAKEWARVADRANLAVDLVHHTRKMGGNEVTAEDSRGASALANCCRSVRAINRMTKEEASQAGVENHRIFFRAMTDKLNLAPPPETSEWYQLESIDLGNGPPGDHVGVAVSWQWPDAFDGLMPGSLFLVQKLIAAGNWKESPQAKNWAGAAVAEALELDISDPKEKAQCRTMLASWIKRGALRVVRHLDETRHERPFIEVGQWATP